MRFGVVVGHTKVQPGAFSSTFGQSEYVWNSDLASRILSMAGGLDIKVFFRDGHGIAGAYAQTDAWGASAVTELHFNSSHNVTSTGTGVLYLAGSARGRLLATCLHGQLSQVLGLSDWPRGTGGVVTPFQASGAQERGKTSLSAGRAPAALIEPFFGSNPDDCSVAASRKDDMARAIVTAFRDYSQKS